jgi:hypothetical protein
MRNKFAVLVGGLVLGLTASLAWAGSVSVSIPFSFLAADKEMPAGQYTITPSSGEDQLTLRSNSGGTTMIPVIERLADTGAKQPKIVFDKMDDGKSFLSEVHVPGSDGFLVGISKGREKHVVVTGKE